MTREAGAAQAPDTVRSLPFQALTRNFAHTFQRHDEAGRTTQSGRERMAAVAGNGRGLSQARRIAAGLENRTTHGERPRLVEQDVMNQLQFAFE
ncbi:hypothetical protein [uncultured Acinetobacter sp.]|uniref:hypothetical protein n=1 Tax=uncultured Acinetobacter sp. TaxID=165433 RepID=UPI0026351D5D|nr:hypothetical protein [uncultured Acinetobacter sp.]